MSFSMLPPELRAIIWGFALPKPRSHIVKSNQMTTKKKKIPVLFQINRESREFVLKHMQLLFEGTNLAGCEDFHFIYFNPKIDTLCLYDMEDNFKFFMGPRNFFLRGVRPDNWEVAPIKECEMVKSLEIKNVTKDTDSLLSKTGLVVRFQKSFGEALYPPFYSSPAHQANTIIFWMTSWAMTYYRFFSLQVTRGKIAAIPDIVFIITKADARFILSTGVSTLEFSGTRTVMNKAVENRLNK
ncbi:hypothetical protein BELL_0120g00150 [Botrytis elliptica]|uniref:2EXR domain-containing protein n=1 Tax=Botrytis elliptica TaxID=278938 RepID=A0A4Z1K118_9HELO|nr:hypothetical protein BELL_0120g00150 [Botrytis elliptica]